MNKEDNSNIINFDKFNWDYVDENNVLGELDKILHKLFSKEEEYEFIYEKEKGYIIYNIVFLRYYSKENIDLENKISNFIINNIKEFKNNNTNILLKSPCFENQIIQEKKEAEYNEFDEYEYSSELCKKCGEKLKSLGEIQKRGLDEGATLQFVCENYNCKKYKKIIGINS